MAAVANFTDVDTLVFNKPGPIISTTRRTGNSTTRARTTTRTPTRRSTTRTTTTTTASSNNDGGFDCNPESGHYRPFIDDNLESLQQQCDGFHACTTALYKSENYLRILSGKGIQLHNICGLLYKNQDGKYNTLDDKCTEAERKAIKEAVGDEFNKVMDEESLDEWSSLRQCLHNNSNIEKSESSFDTLCRLSSPTTVLCRNSEIERTAESKVNKQLEQLHCSCSNLTSKDTSSGNANLAYIAFVGLFAVFIIVIVIMCYRHRKLKRQLKRNTSQGQYSPPDNELIGVYQEIGDPPTFNPDNRKSNPGYNLDDRPPVPPARYVKNASPSQTKDTDVEYFIPLPDISHLKPGQPLPDATGVADNPSQYNTYEMPRYSTPPPAATSPLSASEEHDGDVIIERQLAKQPNKVDVVKQNLLSGTSSEGDRGSRQGRRQIGKDGRVDSEPGEAEPLTAGASIRSDRSEEPKYFLLEDNSTDV